MLARLFAVLNRVCPLCVSCFRFLFISRIIPPSECDRVLNRSRPMRGYESQFIEWFERWGITRFDECALNAVQDAGVMSAWDAPARRGGERGRTRERREINRVIDWWCGSRRPLVDISLTSFDQGEQTAAIDARSVRERGRYSATRG